MVKMACERDTSAFMLVGATALFLMPVSSSTSTFRGIKTKQSDGISMSNISQAQNAWAAMAAWLHVNNDAGAHQSPKSRETNLLLRLAQSCMEDCAGGCNHMAQHRYKAPLRINIVATCCRACSRGTRTCQCISVMSAVCEHAVADLQIVLWQAVQPHRTKQDFLWCREYASCLLPRDAH